MSLFNFGKKKDTVPPDIGQEEANEVVDTSENVEESDGVSEGKNSKNSEETSEVEDVPFSSRGSPVNASRMELERIYAQIKVANTWIKSFQERFSDINEKIGELRNSTLRNEKEVFSAVKESAKAADLVAEVRPEVLRIEYQKLEGKYEALLGRIQANREYSGVILEGLKELKRRSDIFVGTEALLKLNDDTKKDLVNLQKMKSQVQLHADKVEELFIETRNMVAETQKVNSKVDNLDNVYAAIRKDLGKLSVHFGTLVRRKELDDFAKPIIHKLNQIDHFVLEFDRMKENNSRLSEIVEETLNVARRNKTEVTNLALSLGSDKVTNAINYEGRLFSLMNVVSTLAEDVNYLKKRFGVTFPKVNPKKTIPPVQRIVKEEPPSQKVSQPERVSPKDNSLKRELKEIENLLLQGQDLLSKDQKKESLEIYNKIKKLFELLDNQGKNVLYERVESLYNELSGSGKK